MRVLLISTYELGHQPLCLAAPAAALRRDGHEVRCLDLAVEQPSLELFADAELIGISVPMHTAARLGVELTRTLRRLNPRAHVCFYGLYASPLHRLLTESGIADTVAGGEYEVGLRNLAAELSVARVEGGTRTHSLGVRPSFERQHYPVPDRSGLPPLESYARARIGGELRLAGYVEASRGCAHACRHCPITPVYGGRLRLVQREVVLADIDQQVAAGARHITFGDADFFNAVPHSLAVIEAAHRRHPRLSFDVTIKVEHLIEHAPLLPALHEVGCAFITSAFESCNDAILDYLAKGHTRADTERAVEIVRDAGMTLRPTWVAFTPWTALDDFQELLSFVESHGLVSAVQPVQYSLRLLLPPGSPLIELLAEQGRLSGFDEGGLSYGWNNPDPRVEALQREVSAIVERAACTGSDASDNVEVFTQIKRAASRAADGVDRVDVTPQSMSIADGLTEAWFCCAEPTRAQVEPLIVVT